MPTPACAIEMVQREAAQKQLLQQQSTVAAFEERERLARELHDGIGQTLGFINLQAEAARALIQPGRPGERVQNPGEAWRKSRRRRTATCAGTSKI